MPIVHRSESNLLNQSQLIAFVFLANAFVFSHFYHDDPLSHLLCPTAHKFHFVQSQNVTEICVNVTGFERIAVARVSLVSAAPDDATQYKWQSCNNNLCRQNIIYAI